MADIKRLFGMKVIVNPAVEPGSLYIVEPRRGPTDTRSDAERATRVVFKDQSHGG